MRYLLIILLFSTCVSSSDCRFDPAVTEVNGHRGLRGLYPENSIYGFEQTVEKGLYRLELDIILTADHQWVIYHDPSVNPGLCSVEETIPIFDITYDSLSRIGCGTLTSPRFPEQEKRAHGIPRLIDYFQRFRDHPAADSLVHIIEIKSPKTYTTLDRPDVGIMAELFQMLVKEQGMEERVVLQSFDPDVLNSFREIDKGIPILYLIEDMESIEQALYLLTHTPEYVGMYHPLYDESVVAKLHSQGIQTVAWTVNDWPTIERLSCLGVEHVMSDYLWPQAH